MEIKKVLTIGLIVGQVALTAATATSQSMTQKQAPQDDTVVWGT